MSQVLLKRFANESKELLSTAKENSEIFRHEMIGDDISKHRIIVFGPKDTPYDGYKFEVLIELIGNYPLTPPKVKFITPILHMNIKEDSGDVCLDILKPGTWKVQLNMIAVSKSLFELLGSPNVDSPLNTDLASLYKENKSEYETKIKNHCYETSKKYPVNNIPLKE